MMVRPGQQDVERDLVRRLLPLGAFHQRDHAVQKGLALASQVMRTRIQSAQHLGAAGDRRAVAAGLADYLRVRICLLSRPR